MDKRKRKIIIITILIAILLIISLIVFNFINTKDSPTKNGENKVLMKEEFPEGYLKTKFENEFKKLSPNERLNKIFHFSSTNNDDVEFFIYNDYVYFNIINRYLEPFEGETEWTSESHSYVMNNDGSSFKEFKGFENFEYMEDSFIYNNNLYYRERSSSRTNIKINLDTGKSDRLPGTEAYIPNSLKNGKIYGVSESYTGDGNSYKLYLTDLNTEQKNVVAEAICSKSEYYIDYIDNSIFCTSKKDSHLILYRNKDVFLDFDNSNQKLMIIAVDNDNVYYALNNIIYKVSLSTKQIISQKESNIELDSLYQKETGNNIDNIYSTYYKIYWFNPEDISFKHITDVSDAGKVEVHSVNNKLLISYSCFNFLDIMQYYGKEPEIGHIIIYDKSNESIKEYRNILKYTLDGNNLTLLDTNNKFSFIQL